MDFEEMTPGSDEMVLGSDENYPLPRDPSAEGSLSNEQGRKNDEENRKKPIARKRAKIGCDSCRKRRIKCDEARPTCRNCLKSKRHCEGYNQRLIYGYPIDYGHGCSPLPPRLRAAPVTNISNVVGNDGQRAVFKDPIDHYHVGPSLSPTKAAALAANVAEVVDKCLWAFPIILARLEDRDTQSRVKSYWARFQLWVSTMGAHRPAGGRSLEYRLRDSSWLKKHLLGLLDKLLQDLTMLQSVDLQETVRDARDEDADSDVEDELDAYFDDNEDGEMILVDLHVNGVGHAVDSLLRLSVTLRNPAPHDMFEARAGQDTNYLDRYYAGYIRDKFTAITADEANLVERLGRALTQRREYFTYREDHHAKMAAAVEGFEKKGWSDRGTTLASEVPLQQARDEGLRRAPKISLGMFDDDGRSELSRKSYQSSMAGSGQLRVPKMPVGAGDGPFLCPYCYRMTEATTRYEWKKHVYRDLRPYICLAGNCSSTELYPGRSEWIRHMERAHWKTWHCRYGCDHDAGTFHYATDLKTHIEDAHHETGFDFGALETICSKPDPSKTRGSCSFCKATTTTSKADYAKHVGNHLEQIALFSLPRVDGDSEDEDGCEDMDYYSDEEL